MTGKGGTQIKHIAVHEVLTDLDQSGMHKAASMHRFGSVGMQIPRIVRVITIWGNYSSKLECILMDW